MDLVLEFIAQSNLKNFQGHKFIDMPRNQSNL